MLIFNWSSVQSLALYLYLYQRISFLSYFTGIEMKLIPINTKLDIQECVYFPKDIDWDSFSL